ncbi:MAG TPA: S8 family peptidase [Micromonosporaceae bacterium]|nr:S8 family peptidase [Micromonosporaceae bacterium]
MKLTRLLVVAAGMAVAVPLAAAPAAAAPIGPLAPLMTVAAEPGVQAIAGAYIVQVKPGADPAALARGLGVSPRYTYDSAVLGFAATLSDRQLAALRRSPQVLLVEQDAAVSNALDTTQLNPPAWGIDRIDQRNLPLSASFTYTGTGSGVHAYIIDTGIDRAHPNFGGRATFDFNAIDTNNTDCNSHGTHVAGTIGSASYGVAKAVRLHGVKMLNCSGSGTTSATINAVNWVRSNAVRPAVANTSWNWTYSTTLESALVNMINSGVFLATSGGNTGGDSCDRLPRRILAATAVAATDSTDTRASFSSIGACIDIYAPGVSIRSTIPGGSSGLKSGTSMASPHVAGVAALYKSRFGDASQATVNAWLVNNATAGVVRGSLSGTPNRLLFTNL